MAGHHAGQGDTSITLEENYFTYVVAATDVTERGIAQVYAGQDNAPDVLLRRVQQRSIEGQWRLYFPADTITAYRGATLHAFYHARHPRLEDDTTLTNLPPGYIAYYAAAWLAIHALTDDDHYDIRGYRETAPMWMELAERLKRQYATAPLPAYVGYLRQ